jgi:alpha-mannosidase
MLLAALGLSMVHGQVYNFEDDEDDINETLKVHIVPHSYNKELLRTVDVYFPNMQQELI